MSICSCVSASLLCLDKALFVELLAVFVECLVVVLLDCQYQLVLGSPVSEPLFSAVLRVASVSSEIFGVDGVVFTFVVRCVWFVVRSNLRLESLSNLHVGVLSSYICRCVFEAQMTVVLLCCTCSTSCG